MNALSKRQTDKAETSVGDLIKSSPVAHAFKAVGDRWTWLILRDLFLGYRRFEDLRRRTGAARGTLTARLNSLVENGILYRNPYQLDRARFEYRLTDKGFGIYPVALLVWRWEQKWTEEHEEIPEALTHRGCGKKTVPTATPRRNISRPIQTSGVESDTNTNAPLNTNAPAVPARNMGRGPNR